MVDIVLSKNDLPIRLTDERWEHITSQHPEMAEHRSNILQAVANPERILASHDDSMLAVREIESGKWIVVVYLESEEDGFIITAFLTRRRSFLDKRTVIWPL